MEKDIAPPPIESPEKPLVVPEPVVPPAESSPPPPANKKRKVLKILIGALVALAILITGISGYWLYQEKILKKPVSNQEPIETPPAKILFMRENNLWIMNSDGSNQGLWAEGKKSKEENQPSNYLVADWKVGLQTKEDEFTILEYPDEGRIITLPIPDYYTSTISWLSWRDFYYRLPLEGDSSLDNHIVLDTAENKVISKIGETKDCYRLELAPNWKSFICQKRNQLYLGEILSSKGLSKLEIFSEKRPDGKYRMPSNNDFYKIQWLPDSKKAVVFYEAKDSSEISGLPDVPGPSYFNLALIDIESNKIIDFPLKARDLITWNKNWNFLSKDNDLYFYLYGEENLIIWQPFQQKINEAKNAFLPKVGPDYDNMLRLKSVEGDPFFSENLEDNLIIYSALSEENSQTYELRVFNLKTEEDKLLIQNGFINNEFYDYNNQLIVFEKREFEPDSATIKNQNIWTIKLDGSGLKQLTFDGKSQNPSWIKPNQIMP